MVRNSGGGPSRGSLQLPVGSAGDTTPVSPTVFSRTRRAQTVRYRRRSRRQGPSISQLVPVLLEGNAIERRHAVSSSSSSSSLSFYSFIPMMQQLIHDDVQSSGT